MVEGCLEGDWELDFRYSWFGICSVRRRSLAQVRTAPSLGSFHVLGGSTTQFHDLMMGERTLKYLIV